MRTFSVHHRGITLVTTLLLLGVLLGVMAAIVSVTLKQYQFSNIAYDSEVAFQAASAGMECAQFMDWEHDAFTIGTTTEPVCMGQSPFGGRMGVATTSGVEQKFRYSWHTGTNPDVCSEISVFKFYNPTASVPLVVRGVKVLREGLDYCPVGAECTFIEARGYNVACDQLDSGGRVVEREYTILY